MLMDVSALHFVNVGFLPSSLFPPSLEFPGQYWCPQPSSSAHPGGLPEAWWTVLYTPMASASLPRARVFSVYTAGHKGSASELIAPGGTFHHWEIGMVDKRPSFLTLSQDTTVYSTSSSRGPHWDWALVAHKGKQLTDTPFILVLPSLSHFPLPHYSSWGCFPNKLLAPRE